MQDLLKKPMLLSTLTILASVVTCKEMPRLCYHLHKHLKSAVLQL
jgi:hypothetical protein